ncbi:MAG: histidine--tRNA ligase [Deltaproteobacteria bacterium]|jgi:histidyl-tRNA synthetase|nr:histidine--tRNA ligase [Deltaproteobacteria bacterium]
MTITAIRGFNDIMPDESGLWQRIEEEARRTFRSYGFSEIRIPVVERTELFARGIGETTDIVEKEMYTFQDRRGDSLTLRPEGTASVVRAYIEHKLYTRATSKLYYLGPMFRYERPQKGRYRQFYQIGAEVLGEASPLLDAEVIEMLMLLFKRLELKGTALNINSLGCGECRPRYKKGLMEFLDSRRTALCENCQRRIDENPLRALDCKSAHCIETTEDGPSILDHICDGCRVHFEAVRGHLAQSGVAPVVNPRMVRGLDYYSKTTFEITGEGLGAQNTVAAGGRYDGLVKELGGPETPCFGFAIGVERLALLLNGQDSAKEPLFFVALLGGDDIAEKGRGIVRSLRESGFAVERDFAGGGLKAQMKRAHKVGASFVIIVGEDEVARGVVAVKDMQTGTQRDIPLGELEEAISIGLSSHREGA